MARRIMPIMGATLLSEIPWDFIAPHGEQARSNHGGQSLETLASRGGLAVTEVVDIILKNSWATTRPSIPVETWLINKVREWHAAQREKQP